MVRATSRLLSVALAAGLSWSAAALDCPPGECANPAVTQNGRFTFELLGTFEQSPYVTFAYQVCQQPEFGSQSLSHWSLGLLQIDCLLDGRTATDLVVAATLDGEATVFEVVLDPTTGTYGVKFDEGVDDTGCHLWTVTFDTSVLAEDYRLAIGCVEASTKSGPVVNNGYACVLGPVCLLDPTEVCTTDETAWSDGTRYVTRGNWATYTAFTGAAREVTLFAGQHHLAGAVRFSEPSMGIVEICVELAEGFRFDPETDQALKIQDYAMRPSGNPSPGLFRWKVAASGRVACLEVPFAAFYGVHVDVEREIPCE